MPGAGRRLPPTHNHPSRNLLGHSLPVQGGDSREPILGSWGQTAAATAAPIAPRPPTDSIHPARPSTTADFTAMANKHLPPTVSSPLPAVLDCRYLRCRGSEGRTHARRYGKRLPGTMPTLPEHSYNTDHSCLPTRPSYHLPLDARLPLVCATAIPLGDGHTTPASACNNFATEWGWLNYANPA